MIETTGNIWDQKCDWLCITTNCVINKAGRCVMGKGTALQAKQRCPDIDLILAQKIKEKGNIVHCLLKYEDKWIISFPTKNDWRNPSDLDLIKSSAKQLKQHYNVQTKKPIVMLPRPGCSNGQLEWEEVKEVIAPILVEDDFVICDWK